MEKRFIPNIQLFAEGDDKTFTQEEVNKMIEERVARERKKFDTEKKELERKHGETLEDYEERIKNANLTAEEKHKKEVDKLQKDLEAKTQELSKIKTDELKRNILAKHKLPDTFIDRITGATEEEIEKSVTDFSSAVGEYFKSQAGTGVPGALNGGSGKGKTMTVDDFNKLDYAGKVELYNTNKNLYDELTSKGEN